ncbi:hypothetical protein RND81_05G093300 [Saponaria officinalis]|uniref:F-box domain-containing protein n=1 Tax=Saponaria officinalis TaxID=3572 RepID=A0AAW1KVM9_SAPOF
MANSLERYKNLGLKDSICVPYRYPMVCKELGVIIRLNFTKCHKTLQSLLVDHTLFAFRLLPQMQTQSAVSAANLLAQSAESAFPKQKRALAATEFKQAMIAYKRRAKIPQDDKDPVNLPQDVLVHLFCFLDVQSLLTAGLVCRSWNAAANDSYLWQFQYTNHFDGSESILKLTGSTDGDTDVDEKHELSNEVCTNVNQSWKENFRKVYIGRSYKFDRGYCVHCKAIVWLNNLKCPNQRLGQRAKEHQLEPLSSTQIGEYIIDELYIPLFMDSGSGSDDDREEDLEFVPRYGIWERC